MFANLNLYIREIDESVNQKVIHSIKPYLLKEENRVTNLNVSLFIEEFQIVNSKLQRKNSIRRIPGYLPLTPLTFELLVRLYTSELIEDFELTIVNKEGQDIEFHLQGRDLLSNLNSSSKVEFDSSNRPIIHTALNIRWCDKCGQIITPNTPSSQSSYDNHLCSTLEQVCKY